jgi:MFS transporter, putative metabolite:H+ symporter
MSTVIDARIAARIDRLPLSRWHLKIAVPIGTGWFFDAFDALAIAFVLPALIGQWKLDPGQIGLLISGGYLGQIFGSLFFGWLAERIGRSPVTIYTLLIYSIMSLVAAFAWDFGSLLVIRFIQGLGLGGEIPVMATYVNEWASAKRRGRFALLYQWMFAIGIIASAMVATYVVPSFGWQWMFVIGAVPAVFALPLRWLLPESPRWLLSQGRLAEADRILSRVEAEISDNGRLPLPAVKGDDVGTQPARTRLSDLFRGIYLKRTLVVWTIWFCAFIVIYGLSTWMPSVFRSVYKASLQDSIQIGFYMALIGAASTMVAVILIDLIGRKALFAIGLLGATVTLFVLAYRPELELPQVRTLVFTAFFLISFLAISLSTYTAELYPTELRAFGVGAGNAWLRFSSVVGPAIVGFILPIGGIANVYLMFGLFAAIGLFVTLLFAIETRGRMLEELSPSIIRG